jgi:hypothetical protein
MHEGSSGSRENKKLYCVNLRWHRPIVYLVSLKCYVNRQIQPYRSKVQVLYSALLHVSAVYISHHQGSKQFTKNWKVTSTLDNRSTILVNSVTRNIKKKCSRAENLAATTTEQSVKTIKYGAHFLRFQRFLACSHHCGTDIKSLIPPFRLPVRPHVPWDPTNAPSWNLTVENIKRNCGTLSVLDTIGQT